MREREREKERGRGRERERETERDRERERVIEGLSFFYTKSGTYNCARFMVQKGKNEEKKKASGQNCGK